MMNRSSFFLFCFFALTLLSLSSQSRGAHASAELAVGNPVPALSPGVVSRIPILVRHVTGPGVAGFDLRLNLSAGDISIQKVNGTTNPPGLEPGKNGWSYKEHEITAYLPLKGINADPAKNESGLGRYFLNHQGPDGVLELLNTSESKHTARFAYVYQSPRNTQPITAGDLVNIYVYVGREVPFGTTIELTLSPPESQQMAAFAGLAVTPALITGHASQVFSIADVDGDGFVNLKDAIMIIRLLSGRPSPGTLRRIDVNRDGVPGLAEVMYILQEVAQRR